MNPILFYLLTIVIVICDQVSKWAVLRSIPVGVSEPLLGKWLYLTHIQNSGGAFSVMQAKPYVFITIAFLAIGALLYVYHRFQRSNLLVSAGLSLALGGAIGNLIDRILYGSVIDFFDIRIWPIFNIADSAITMAIILMSTYFIFHKESPSESPAHNQSSL